MEEELIHANNGHKVSSKEVMGKMGEHFGQWFSRIENNFADMFGTIGEGIEKEDDALIAQELEYFMSCHSCKLTVTYLKDIALDTMNKQLISSFLSTQC